MKIVFDIDGTLSDPSHRLHFIQKRPKDWDGFFAACYADDPIPAGIAIARLFIRDRQDVEFWTGRPWRTQEDTVDWLCFHLGTEAAICPLRMRGDNDRRHDTLVKAEYLDPDDPPDLIFEDRARVVEMFRTKGLTVYQVARGDF